MALVADEGLALFCGLNAMPKKSFLSEYSSRITPQKVSRLLALWHAQLTGEKLFAAQSLNLDFHSVPYFGEHPIVEYSTAIEFAVFRGVKGQSRAVRLEKRGNRPAIFGACRFLPPQMWAESCSEILAREKAHENGAAPAADLGWPSLKPRAKIGVGFEFYRRGTAFDQQR